jgi:hypothetical protein
MRWTKETALPELQALADETRIVVQQRRSSEQHSRWLLRTLTVLEEIFGQSRYYFTIAGLKWRHTGRMIVGGVAGRFNAEAVAEQNRLLHQTAYLRDLETARGVLLAAIDQLQRSDLASVYQGKDTAPESSAIIKIIKLAETKLRKVIKEPPAHERQVQDAFESLLHGADIPFSREKERIEYSTGTYAPDFTMPKLDLATEIKFCPKEGREREIIAEINDDILAYRKKYGNLLFVVYDVGKIRDVERFVASFEEHENVIVRVVKH